MMLLWRRLNFVTNFKTCQGGSRPWGGSFDIAHQERRLGELELQANSTELWNNADHAKQLLRERAAAQASVDRYRVLASSLDEAWTAFDLAQESGDQELFEEAERLLASVERSLSDAEFLSKMHGEYDRLNAIIEMNAGSGGTEAQDWALMLLRMYVRWSERKGFKLEELDYRAGEEAGIKSATLYIEGDFAYGLLRGEQGVHRLVRISPFDSNARRHTSFASVAEVS